jgi:hypothetical protein
LQSLVCDGLSIPVVCLIEGSESLLVQVVEVVARRRLIWLVFWSTKPCRCLGAAYRIFSAAAITQKCAFSLQQLRVSNYFLRPVPAPEL